MKIPVWFSLSLPPSNLEQMLNTEEKTNFGVMWHQSVLHHSSLHWLPVTYRIMYKILVLTYKCIHELAPIYLQELIEEYKPSRNLRSSSQLNLVSTSVSTLSYGNRSFRKASAELWNRLPLNVKNCQTVNLFKTSLKTHLFKIAFDDWLTLFPLMCIPYVL